MAYFRLPRQRESLSQRDQVINGFALERWMNERAVSLDDDNNVVLPGDVSLVDLVVAGDASVAGNLTVVGSGEFADTLKATGGDNTLQLVTTSNSWATYFTAFGCWKDAAGGVHLQGMLRNGTGLAIGTLPVGFRPASTQIFTVHETATGTARRVDISSAGVVAFSGAYPAAGVWFDLAGISFYAGW